MFCLFFKICKILRFTSCGPFPLKAIHNTNDGKCFIPYDREIIEFYFKNYVDIFMLDDDGKIVNELIWIFNQKPILTEDLKRFGALDLKKEYKSYLPPKYLLFDQNLYMKISCKKELSFYDTMEIKFDVITHLTDKIRRVKIQIDRIWNSNNNIVSSTLCSEIHNYTNTQFSYRKSFSLHRDMSNYLLNLFIINLDFYDPYYGFFKTETKTVHVSRYILKISHIIGENLEFINLIEILYKNNLPIDIYNLNLNIKISTDCHFCIHEKIVKSLSQFFHQISTNAIVSYMCIKPRSQKEFRLRFEQITKCSQVHIITTRIKQFILVFCLIWSICVKFKQLTAT
ncbi:hypothetical protein HZS_6844 [Henneguya salminicola]|nr:hypothetical protein HZS_6844 [Henneguya salminicola]